MGPRLLQRRWLEPVLDVSVRVFRRAYRHLEAPEGTAVVFEVEGETELVWSVVREASAWCIVRGRMERPAASFRVDGDTAWRLLYDALPPDAAAARGVMGGERSLIAPMLCARSVMVRDTFESR